MTEATGSNAKHGETVSNPSGGAEEDDRRIVERSGRFDETFYRRLYAASIPAGQTPLGHFLAEGCRDGLLASADFDPIVYKLAHPCRQNANPLIDSVLRGDEGRYRDLARLFDDLAVGSIPLTYRFEDGLRDEMKAKATLVAENVARPLFMPWMGTRYRLSNPPAEAVLSRLAENRSFCFGRLPHGFWDTLCTVDKIVGRLREDPRCLHLGARELENLAIRLLASKHLVKGGFGTFAENMLREIETDLAHEEQDEDFWTAVSLRGAPSFDDGLHGLNKEDVAERLEVLSRFFKPSDVLYDATLWKRWALSGDLLKLAEAARPHPVVLVGPAKFRSLGAQWRLRQFHHVPIAAALSQLIRYSLLDRIEAAVENAVGAAGSDKPIVFFQCGGSLAYWFIRRLRPTYPDLFYIDLGQALDLWQWSHAPWMRVYEETLLAANPFVERDAADASAARRAPASESPNESDLEVRRILEHDYEGGR